VLIRSKVGSFIEAEELESTLHRWIVQYVTADSEASAETKAAYPLREARIQVREHPGKPGSYLCVAHLWPHFELDELNASVKIATELSVKEAK
jgi:predicted component of type VI protein secretion system